MTPEDVDELEAEILALRQAQALLLQAADEMRDRASSPFVRRLRNLGDELGFRAEQRLRWRRDLERVPQ